MSTLIPRLVFNSHLLRKENTLEFSSTRPGSGYAPACFHSLTSPPYLLREKYIVARSDFERDSISVVNRSPTSAAKVSLIYSLGRHTMLATSSHTHTFTFTFHQLESAFIQGNIL